MSLPEEADQPPPPEPDEVEADPPGQDPEDGSGEDGPEVNPLPNRDTNNWNVKTQVILEEWIKESSKIIEAHSYAREQYLKMSEKYSISLLVLTTITSSVSITQFNVDESNKDLALFMKLLTCLFSFLATIISGVQKIYRFSEVIDKLNQKIREWNDFSVELHAELQKPFNMRKDAHLLIQSHSKLYSDLQRSGVDVILPEKYWKRVGLTKWDHTKTECMIQRFRLAMLTEAMVADIEDIQQSLNANDECTITRSPPPRPTRSGKCCLVS